MADLPITSDAGATPIVVNDPTTTANVANVKAASTASVAADNSLVVALSPNSPVPTGTNKIGVTGVTQGSTTSGQNGDLVQGAVTTAAPSYSTGQTSPLSLTTIGNLRVDGSSVIQPVSGTVTANQGIPNTAANKWPIEIVDSGGVNVASVNASNELLVTDTDLTLAQGSTTSGELGPLVQGAVTTAAPTYVTAQTNPLSLTTAGDLRTVAKTQDGSGNNITSTALGTKQGLDVNLIASPSQSAAASGQVYTTSFEFNLPTNGTESPAVFIKNPSGSGKTLILKILSATCEDGTNGAAVIRVYGDPTTSANGTSQTISSTSVGGGAAASAMTSFSGPTASANGTVLFSINTGSGNVSQPADMPIYFDGIIRVSANHTLLVTGEPTTNNMNYSFAVMWQEV
jgi:hypothetical protein